MLTETCPLLTALSAATPTFAFSKAESSIIDLSRFKIKDATKNETIAATAIPDQTHKTFTKPPADLADAIPVIAIIEPGEAGAARPEPSKLFVKVPDTPPAITAKKSAGFIMT